MSVTTKSFKVGLAYGIPIPEDDPRRSKARSIADEIGSLKGSIEDGDGNFAGILAELVIADVLGAERDANYNRDLTLTTDQGQTKTIDAKTKRRTCPPKGYYDCSVADYNTTQDCTFYYFNSLDTEENIMWMLGYLNTHMYYDKATFHREGEYDPDNSYVFPKDCWNVAISELHQPVRYLDQLSAASVEKREF